MSRAAPQADQPAGDPAVLNTPNAHPFTWLDAVLATLIAVGYGTFCGYSARRREWLNQFVETDYLVRFLTEAERIMAGQTLVLDFHPPLYPAVLAAVKAFGVQRWLTVGLIVSAVTLSVAAFATYYTLHRVAGRAVALGATLALGICPLIFGFAIQATSDIFFLAVYAVVFALLAFALQRNSTVAWATTGLALGLTLLTRTNGIILLPLLAVPLLPFLTRGLSRSARFKHTAGMLAGLALPIAIWFAYAIPTGSPLKPTSNWVNLALTFYSPGDDRVNYDTAMRLQEQFSGTLDVLTHDPARIARVYFRDLVRLPGHLLFDLLPWPIIVLALPGLVGLIRKGRHPLTLILFGITLLHILLLNCKAWDPRFYFFLVPIFGAGAAYSLVWLWSRPRNIPAIARRAVVMAACLGGLVLLNQARGTMWGAVPRWLNPEFTQSLNAAREFVPPGSIIQSRKPHLAYYLNATPTGIPLAETAAEYERWLTEVAQDQPTFVYVGHFEQTMESSGQFLQDPAFPPPSLEKLAEGDTASGLTWTLYRFHPPQPPANP